ncbi:nucleotide-binding domain-containing protein [Neofusicoccum parvum]|nr:nucleotide-binding domain-containing protein [Neofusicoccum parvum]
MAAAKGVVFKFGPQEGAFHSLVEERLPTSATLKRAIGLKTKDGIMHKADVTVMAAGSFSTQLLPELSYHLESSSGSIATLKIDKGNVNLWEKYSPERFPVMTWKSKPRNSSGKDTGSVYAFPRTAEGLIKIGYRGIKFTNFQPAPPGTPFTQDNQWDFISIFLPEFKDAPFHSTKLCWYTDSLDNSFVIDYVPKYADKSVFVCTGGSGHGAKFLPVLGEHAADIFENGDGSSSYMRRFWRWRDETPRGNGLEEGPAGPRNIGGARKVDQ